MFDGNIISFQNLLQEKGGKQKVNRLVLQYITEYTLGIEHLLKTVNKVNLFY